MATVSRSNISYAINVASKFVENPSKIHWNAVKRLIKYIKRTLNFGLVYKSKDNFFNIAFLFF